jgi:hypothetical protein
MKCLLRVTSATGRPNGAEDVTHTGASKSQQPRSPRERCVRAEPPAEHGVDEVRQDSAATYTGVRRERAAGRARPTQGAARRARLGPTVLDRERPAGEDLGNNLDHDQRRHDGGDDAYDHERP